MVLDWLRWVTRISIGFITAVPQYLYKEPWEMDGRLQDQRYHIKATKVEIWMGLDLFGFARML